MRAGQSSRREIPPELLIVERANERLGERFRVVWGDEEPSVSDDLGKRGAIG